MTLSKGGRRKIQSGEAAHAPATQEFSDGDPVALSAMIAL
jgi:hypothetical protein